MGSEGSMSARIATCMGRAGLQTPTCAPSYPKYMNERTEQHTPSTENSEAKSGGCGFTHTIKRRVSPPGASPGKAVFKPRVEEGVSSPAALVRISSLEIVSYPYDSHREWVLTPRVSLVVAHMILCMASLWQRSVTKMRVNITLGLGLGLLVSASAASLRGTETETVRMCTHLVKARSSWVKQDPNAYILQWH